MRTSSGARLSRFFGEMTQRVCHRFAWNSDNAGKWMVEFEDYENGAGDRERAGDEGESARGIRRCEQAKAKEDHHKPQDQRDQQRLRNR